MMAIDEEMLVAYADGELEAKARAEVERALASDVGLRARLERQQRLRARLAAHYGPVAEEEVPDRLTDLLGGGQEDEKVVDLAAARARRSRPLWQTVTALAATLVLGLFAGQMLPRGGSGPFAVQDGTMVARGALAEALDTQLASAQPQDAATRVGVSFEAADGRLCRTFESAAASGLACRGHESWQLVMTAPGAAPAEGGAYRQAGSGNMLVMQAAQEMMAGEPLDAEGERRARDAGWRNRVGRD